MSGRAIREADAFLTRLSVHPDICHIIKSTRIHRQPHIVTVQGGDDALVEDILTELKNLYLIEQNLRDSTQCIFGFDLERDGETVETLQFSTRYIAVVFLLNKIDSQQRVPGSIKSIISDSSILKMGVGLHNDRIAMQQCDNMEMYGAIDLSHLAVQEGLSPSYLGLKKLGEQILNISYPKGHAGIPWSDVDPKIHFKMIRYAAMDAYLGYKLSESFFEKLGTGNIYSWLVSVSDRIMDQKNLDEAQPDEEDDKKYESRAAFLLQPKQLRRADSERRANRLENILVSKLPKRLDEKQRKRKRNNDLDNTMADALAALKGATTSEQSNNSSKRRKRQQEPDDSLSLNIY